MLFVRCSVSDDGVQLEVFERLRSGFVVDASIFRVFSAGPHLGQNGATAVIVTGNLCVAVRGSQYGSPVAFDYVDER